MTRRDRWDRRTSITCVLLALLVSASLTGCGESAERGATGSRSPSDSSDASRELPSRIQDGGQQLPSGVEVTNCPTTVKLYAQIHRTGVTSVTGSEAAGCVEPGSVGADQAKRAAEAAVNRWAFEESGRSVDILVVFTFSPDQSRESLRAGSSQGTRGPVRRVYVEPVFASPERTRLVLQTVVDSEGKVTAVEVLEAPANVRSAALWAARQWVYEAPPRSPTIVTTVLEWPSR